MQSKLFSNHDLANHSEFPKDFRALCEMSEQAIAALPQFVLAAQLAPTRAEADKVVEKAASELRIPKNLVERAIDLARFFLRESVPHGEAESDSTEMLIADLNEMFGIPDGKGEALASMLAQLRTQANDKLRITLLKRAHAASALPILSAVSTQVDFRAVFDEEYKYEEDVSTFSPTFLGTVPVGILSLSLSGGDVERVSLQLSKRNLQILLDHLVALQKQIAIAEKHVGCGEEK